MDERDQVFIVHIHKENNRFFVKLSEEQSFTIFLTMVLTLGYKWNSSPDCVQILGSDLRTTVPFSITRMPEQLFSREHYASSASFSMSRNKRPQEWTCWPSLTLADHEVLPIGECGVCLFYIEAILFSLPHHLSTHG